MQPKMMAVQNDEGRIGEAPLYEYKPLDGGHIRILILEPGTFGLPLHARLEHRWLSIASASPAYDNDSFSVSTADSEGGDDLREPRDGNRKEILSDQDGSIWNKVLEDDSEYVALSYAWGVPEFSHSIVLENRAELPITRSLYEALQRLRSENCSRRLWVDAVCIKQRDAREKSSQVARIGNIFKGCKACIDMAG